MESYKVKLYPSAARDLEEIYLYLSEVLLEPMVAQRMANALEQAIFSLEQFPERGAVRRIGKYADQDYRQLFVKKYLVLYSVKKEEKEVHILAVRYAGRQF